jgi:PadR family transcriptional regulator PadR
MATRNPDLLPGTLDMLIMKTLLRAPNHGYGIAQYIQRISEDALRVGEGSLYPALQRLLINEWVAAEWGISDTGRKVRMYTITPAGRKQLQQEAKDYGFLIAGIARVMEAR